MCKKNLAKVAKFQELWESVLFLIFEPKGRRFLPTLYMKKKKTYSHQIFEIVMILHKFLTNRSGQHKLVFEHLFIDNSYVALEIFESV